MFHHILVPLDFSPKDQAALNAAVAIAKRSGSRLTLVHVIRVVEHTDPAELSAFYEELRRNAAARLGPVAMRLTEEEQLAVDWELILGRPTAGILKVAADCKADLIILSSHRIDPAHPTEGWGTISHQISVLAVCPVLLVK
jgi:nucleotide-binding universal stress UspA family protein